MADLGALALGALLVVGVIALIAGLRPRDPGTVPTASSRRWRHIRHRIRVRLTKRVVIRICLAFVAGIAALAITGWPVLAVVLPAAVLILPVLLSEPPNRDLELLGALDRWVRLVSATISTGVSIPDAIRATRRQVPPLLADSVSILIARLDDRWTVRQALRTTADELASPDADAVLCALILATERGGTGAVATLTALADSIQDRLRAGREIAAENAKPRIVVRQVTVLSVVVLAIALVLGGPFFAPYGTWYGQVILGVLVTIYLGSLLWLRRLTATRPRERILQ